MYSSNAGEDDGNGRRVKTLMRTNRQCIQMGRNVDLRVIIIMETNLVGHSKWFENLLFNKHLFIKAIGEFISTC